MDELRQDDLRTARETPPAVKLRQALELMALGLRLERAKLRRRYPVASEGELQALLEGWWLERD